LLQAVDDALESAAKAKQKTSKEADEAFKNAVKTLTDYDPDKAVRVAERMEKAEDEDKFSLKVFNRLKETFRVRDELTPLPRRVLILILAAAAGRGTENRSRVSSP
jgi:phosphate uptake regulator